MEHHQVHTRPLHLMPCPALPMAGMTSPDLAEPAAEHAVQKADGPQACHGEYYRDLSFFQVSFLPTTSHLSISSWSNHPLGRHQ
jgi:hypothetical protein